MKENISSKSTGLKDIRTLTGSSLLVAMSVIVDFFRIVISNILEISFGFAPIALGGAIYGPIVGGIIGGIADIIQYLVRSSGPFFPGFTLNAILTGIIYGLFLYKKEITLKRIVLCVLVEGILITIILTPIWLNILYGAKFFAIPRIIKFVALFPIKVSILYALLKLLKQYKMIRQ
ncbi:folate family ECF transporter S component [Peptostreptococcus canis]|uniref:Folate family ECF transporter S component n=1 Tax=Peptostreptococcus canis TaxID=1159213 RepID=A0ABR6TIG1_9FIRM|nr:folate family ECF transporter S component [Peptostreptococcus canis]MBC2575095.1 folate family ECF transporter S component [Peptostreptococcus canis]MBP1997731.1 ECF transporter S component (folate family) [Peptostreptococcus canis]